MAILFVEKPKLSNKENKTTTKNQKICQKFPTKEKPTINFKPIIFDEKEEKIEKTKKAGFENKIQRIKNDNYEKEIMLNKLKNTTNRAEEFLNSNHKQKNHIIIQKQKTTNKTQMNHLNYISDNKFLQMYNSV